jgi:hypothetical protein
MLQMGAGADIVAYPVADGKLLNVAAFVYVLPGLPLFVYPQNPFQCPRSVSSTESISSH